MTLRSMQLIAAASVLPLTLSIASADTFNKKTKLSFSQPIRVPGTTLSAGSYIFKLVDSQANRNIVQIMNVRENKYMPQCSRYRTTGLTRAATPS